MIELSEQEEQRFGGLCQMAFNFARNDDCENLRVMIEAGLNVNLKTHKGDTLLMLASYHDSINCAKMLLQKGAFVDERNDRGQTPLAGVCFKGHLEMAKLLLTFGANPNANNGLGATPYTFAILFGRQEIAELLIKYSQVSFFKRIPLTILRLIKKLKFRNRSCFAKEMNKIS